MDMNTFLYLLRSYKYIMIIPINDFIAKTLEFSDSPNTLLL